MNTNAWRKHLHDELASELRAIARWWLEHVIDLDRGTIVGEVSASGHANATAPLSLVYVARLLWFFSALARRSGEAEHRAAADLCRTVLLRDFQDPQHGGLFWRIAADGRPLARKKQTYGLAFAVYALAEHRRAFGDDESLLQAAGLARLIEERLLDREHGGFLEALDRDWQPLDDVRLGPTDLDADKTLNTHLHLLEAWTALVRVDPAAAPRLRALLELYLARFTAGPDATAIGFYTRDWTPLRAGHSPGHAIEASWLLCEAAEVLRDPAAQAAVRAAALDLAAGVLNRALDSGGGVVAELGDEGVADGRRVWWVQAEALVGFFNAWQLGGDERYLRASRNCWSFIRDHHVDAQRGEWRWYSALDAGAPATYIAGAWKGPYHNGRALMEMLRRLAPQR